MAKSRKLLTVGALGVAAAALIATGSGVTGAYFTDSHSGSINASTGGVTVTTSALTLNFTNLLPGEFKSQPVTYTAGGSGAEDIWLVFPTPMTSATAILNGQKGTPGADPALGRYGHFAVTSPAGNFTSYNLTAAAVLGGDDSCTADLNGHGGSDTQATSANNLDPTSYVDYCPVPNAILLSDNLTAGQSGTANITFGYTKLYKADAAQNVAIKEIAPFSIVATQHGILPTDVNNVVRTP